MRALRVNETKITTENTFNQGNFGIEGNYESDNDGKPSFYV